MLVERFALHLADKALPVVMLDYKHVVRSEHAPTPYLEVVRLRAGTSLFYYDFSDVLFFGHFCVLYRAGGSTVFVVFFRELLCVLFGDLLRGFSGGAQRFALLGYLLPPFQLFGDAGACRSISLGPVSMVIWAKCHGSLLI